MTRRTLLTAVAGVLSAAAMLPAQQPPADLVLTNGRILTVDDRFSTAQGIAIRGSRIAGVGSNEQVERLAGPATRRIDLRGRTVIPGLIDNHMHLLRAGTTWQREVRWDGVGTRMEALNRLRARVKTTPPGEWIYSLGGWAVDQFADDSRPFTREELDSIAPAHPVLLQASYFASYLNSRAIEALGLDERSPAWALRGGGGRLTGVIEEAGIRSLAARLPVATGDQLEVSTRQMIGDLNRAGLTSFGSAGCETDVLPLYRRLAGTGQLNLRVFCITSGAGTGAPPVDRLLARATADRGGAGTLIDHVAYGEGVYGPLHDPMFVPRSDPRPDDLREWKRLVTNVARARQSLHVHANLTNTIDAFLDQIEGVAAAHPIRDLRWTLAHVNQINASHLTRMKALGLHAAVHPWAIINGGINRSVFGEAALDMPPLRTIQASGVVWGLGSDGSRANQVLPFTTLWFAVTGKMVGGRTVLRETISREQALVAHTRSNATLLFQEQDLGSLEAGKLADLVVLDRDYLTVPADQIKDIRPVMTIVGGRIVHDTGR